MELYCPNCGYEDYEESRFCAMCGVVRSPDIPEPPEIDEATGKLPPLFLLANRYEIRRQVGQGGMAAVYESVDLRTNRRLAIKELAVVKISEPDEREQVVNQFYREAQLLANLSHPNLPRVTDFFYSLGKYYLVMDFIEGESLKRLQQRLNEPLPEPQIIAWAVQLCDALIYLHSQTPPIVFRDLKPSNIMVEPAGQIKLIDFGIARLFEPNKTQDTVAFGTVGYAPPEQYGSAQSDPRADVYALGVTLYELLTNYDPTSRPFGLPPIDEIKPNIPKDLATIIMGAIAFEAAARWQTVGELKDEIIAYQIKADRSKPHTGRLSVSMLLEPRRVPLMRALEEAKEKAISTKRRMVINRLASSLVEKNPFESNFVVMIGYRGVGTSEICRRAKEIVLSRQKGVVGLIDASSFTQLDATAQFWEEVLLAMKSGEQELDWRMKHAIEATYRKYRSASSNTPTEVRVSSPFAFKFDLGVVSGVIGETPFELKRAGNEQPISIEQTLQQQRERLFRSIRELASYLVHNGVRVVLFFDNVIDATTLELLRPFTAIGGLSAVFVMDPERYENWSQEHKDLIKKTIYVECLWNLGRDMCEHLVNKNSREARTTEYQLFVRSLEYQGRGLPRNLISELEKYYDDPTNEAALKRRLGLTNPALVIAEERLMSIRMYGELQQILDGGWKSLLVSERGLPLVDLQKEWSRDQMRLGVYKTLGWMLDRAANGQPIYRAKLYKAVESNTQLSKRKSEELGRNLIALLQKSGKIEVTSRGSINAVGMLPTVQIA